MFHQRSSAIRCRDLLPDIPREKIQNPGKARRDELHFELRKANRPVDPVPQLPASPGKALAAKSAE